MGVIREVAEIEGITEGLGEAIDKASKYGLRLVPTFTDVRGCACGVPPLDMWDDDAPGRPLWIAHFLTLEEAERFLDGVGTGWDVAWRCRRSRWDEVTMEGGAV